MKIIHLIDIPWDSGLANYALILGQGLQKRGHTVYIGCKPGEKPWDKAQRMGLQTVPYTRLTDALALRKFLIDQSIHIVNAHTGSTHTLAITAAVGLRTRVIRTRSDARPVRRSFGSGFLFHRTARVIAAAEYIRRDFLQTLHLSDEKVITVYQGLDLETFSPSPLPEKPTLGIIARLDPVKGHHQLLSALSALKAKGLTPRLDVVGQSENIKQADLEALVNRWGLQEQVKFWGYQSDIPGAMRACSIGVIASTGSEAVSRAALEWMASGRPVIATRVGCLPELIKEGETGCLVAPDDPAALAAAIARFIKDPVSIQQMGEAARRHMQTRFSVDHFVEHTADIYSRAVTS